MQVSTIVAVLAALAIGFGGGYVVAGRNPSATSSGAGMNMSNMSMSDMMASMNAALEGKSGDEFDKAFLQEMIAHHQGAVAMAQLAVQRAKHAEIQRMAREIIASQTKEISTMRGWLQSWYGK